MRRWCATRCGRFRTSGSARSWSEAPRSCAAARTTACRSSTASHGAEVVVDLSDEPVLGPAERLRWASRALAEGLPYVGADFRFDPPVLEPFDLPSIAVIGTGKRVGKTAVTTHLARLLARDRSVVVVAMGRGGPPEPEVVESRAVARRARRALACRPARGVRPPRDRGARRSADDRVPARGRRPGRRGVRLERRGGRRARCAAEAPTSSSSTAAAPRSRRSTSIAGFWWWAAASPATTT